MADGEMSKKERGKALEKRTRQFAVQMIKLSGELPKTEAGRVVKYQMVKSGTSVGANYQEANRSVSKADFRNKIGIGMKESSKTAYWLEVIVEAALLPFGEVKSAYEESQELLALFTSSCNTSGKSS